MMNSEGCMKDLRSGVAETKELVFRKVVLSLRSGWVIISLTRLYEGVRG